MALLDAPDFYGYTLFCDDIRTEADGKMTYVGRYLSHMLVHSDFPVSLPKFGFGIAFVQLKKLFDPNLGIRIFLPQDSLDSPSIQADLRQLAEAAYAAAPESDPIEPNSQPVIALHANLILAPLQLTAAGFIRVRIQRGDDLVRIGALTITRSGQSIQGIPAASGA
jgi:hypothetical protein